MANLRTNNLSGEQGQNAYRGSVFFAGNNTATGLRAVESDSNLTFGTGDFTIEFWILRNNSDNAVFLEWRHTSGGNQGVRITLYADSNLKLYVSGINIISGSDPLTTNSWHHVALARASSSTRLFVNGVQFGSTYSDSGDYVGPQDSGGIYIGRFGGGSYDTKGYISNLRIVKGTALYTSDFTPPQSELTVVDGTVLLCCQDSDDPTKDAVGTTITAEGNLSNTDLTKQQPKVIPPFGVDAGNTFGGPIKKSSQGYMYFPTGRTEERGRGRGIVAGGSPGADNNEQIEVINIQSDGVVTDFGELATARRGCGGCSSSTRGLVATGTAGNPSPSYTSSIEKFEIAITSNGTSFGDLNNNTRNIAGLSNETRGLFAGGGDNPSLLDVIDFVTIATTGDATDFGNLTAAKKGSTGVSSPTRGLFGGGLTPSVVRTIDLVTIATAGNATDFGDLVGDVFFCGGVSSPTRGVWGGGSTPSQTNIIQFVTIATTGDATDFGDLTDERNPDNSQICSHTRGLFVGGENPGPSACNIIDAIIISSTGNATDFGDIRTTTSQSAGCSDCHGGLS